MRYAIVESGGKQYRAVEGETLEVDRLPDDEGTQIGFERILMMADGEDFMIGTPTVGGVEVKATVLDHFSGSKVTNFKYSPKKRIRVRGGHRQQYTRLTIDFIGSKGETRKATKPAPTAENGEPDSRGGKSEAGQLSTKQAASKSAGKKTPVKKAIVPGKSGGGAPARKSAKKGGK